MSNTSLPPMQTTFSLDVKGEDTGKQFTGDFTYKRLTIRDRANVSLYHSKLKKGEKEVNPEMDNVLYMVAFLKYSIIESPQWWKDSDYGLELHDVMPIAELFMKSREFEDKFHEAIFGKEEEKKEAK